MISDFWLGETTPWYLRWKLETVLLDSENWVMPRIADGSSLWWWQALLRVLIAHDTTAPSGFLFLIMQLAAVSVLLLLLLCPMLPLYVEMVTWRFDVVVVVVVVVLFCFLFFVFFFLIGEFCFILFLINQEVLIKLHPWMQNFCLFWKKKIFFLFCTLIFTKHLYQFIYSTIYFI